MVALFAELAPGIAEDMPVSGNIHSLLGGSVIFLGLDEGLLGDEDSVEELTLVLATDTADLLDARAALGEGSVVDAVEDELTLDVGAELHGGAALHDDVLVLLAAQEVLDGDAGAVLGDHDVDGEMSVHESHLVAVALNSRSNSKHIP